MALIIKDVFPRLIDNIVSILVLVDIEQHQFVGFHSDRNHRIV